MEGFPTLDSSTSLIFRKLGGQKEIAEREFQTWETFCLSCIFMHVSYFSLSFLPAKEDGGGKVIF